MEEEFNGSRLPMNKRPRRAKLNSGTLVTAVMLVIIALLAYLIVKNVKENRTPKNVSEPQVINAGVGYDVPGETPAPQPQLRPTASAQGMLPVYFKAGTNEPCVAITVQGLASRSDMDKLLEDCRAYGAQLTFFPTGRELSEGADFWGDALLNGHEIESGGYSGGEVKSMSQSELENEVDAFEALLRSYVGEGYELHFFRTNSINDDSDPRLNAYLQSKGYYGLAGQAVTQPSKLEEISPGAVIFVNLKSYDVGRVREMLRALYTGGYSMLTLNALFGYSGNLAGGAETEY